MSNDIVLVPVGELIGAAEPTPADQNPMLVYLGGLASGSQPTMRNALVSVAELLAPGVEPVDVAWHMLRFQHVARLRQVLVDVKKYAPATVNRMIAAVRGVVRAAWLLGLVSADDYQRVRAVKLVQASTELVGRSVAAPEFEKLFLQCDDTPIGNRNAVIVSLLYGCGLRRAEAASVALADYDRGENSIKVRRGKGRKDRTVYLPVGARRALDAWIACRGKAQGALICPVHKTGAIKIRALSPSAIWHVLVQLARDAGVAKLTPHDLRRSVASDMLDAGVDLVTVQRFLGHADPRVTARYDRRPGRVVAAAARKITVPFGR